MKTKLELAEFQVAVNTVALSAETLIGAAVNRDDLEQVRLIYLTVKGRFKALQAGIPNIANADERRKAHKIFRDASNGVADKWEDRAEIVCKS